VAAACLRLALLMSHLVASEEPANPITPSSFPRFRAFVKRCGAPASFAQLSGVFSAPTIIRPPATRAAALYGINPCPTTPPHAAGRDLACTVLQTRRVDALQTVGYGGAWRSAGPPRRHNRVGFADAYFRTLINRSVVYIGPTTRAGDRRISMDLVTTM